MPRERFKSNYPESLPIAVGSLLLFTAGCSVESALILAKPTIFILSNLAIFSCGSISAWNTALYFFGRRSKD